MVRIMVTLFQGSIPWLALNTIPGAVGSGFNKRAHMNKAQMLARIEAQEENLDRFRGGMLTAQKDLADANAMICALAAKANRSEDDWQESEARVDILEHRLRKADNLVDTLKSDLIVARRCRDDWSDIAAERGVKVAAALKLLGA